MLFTRPAHCRAPQHAASRPAGLRSLRCCSSGPQPGMPEEDWAKMATDMLENDPEARAQLNRVADAAKKVAELQAMQAEYQKAMDELAQQTAAEMKSQAGVLPTNVVGTIQSELAAAAAAEKALTEAQEARDRLQQESRVMEERFRSLIAGVVAAAGGTVGFLPYALSTYGSGPRAVLSIVMVLSSTFLFGATYRYLLGTGNPKLKQGAVGAFAIVRGVSLIEERTAPIASQGTSAISPQLLTDCGVDMGESFLVFLFAAAALEFALKQGWTTPGTDL